MKLIKIAISCLLLFGAINCKPTAFFKMESDDSASRTIKTINSTDYEIFGATSNYGVLKTDGLADFGLVLKSFTRNDLFQIELNDLMSTDIDKIRIIGNDIEIPTNVALPQQRERYVLSINLNKPQYSVKLNRNQDQRIVLLHGQFPFESVVDGFRNDEPLLKLVNQFDVLSYSNYTFYNSQFVPRINLDLEAGQYFHRDRLQIQAPQKFKAGFNYVVVSLEKENSIYLANNITVLKPKESRSFKIGTNQAEIFSGFIHESFAEPQSDSILKNTMSFKLQKASVWTPDILDFITDLNYNSNFLSFSLPDSKELHQLGLAYSIVEINQLNEEVLIFSNHLIGPWTNKLDLGLFESLRNINSSYRLDLYVLASSEVKTPLNRYELFELAEYVSRHSLNL